MATLRKITATLGRITATHSRGQGSVVPSTSEIYKVRSCNEGNGNFGAYNGNFSNISATLGKITAAFVKITATHSRGQGSVVSHQHPKFS